VVIAIIALLMAVLLPALSRVRRQAKAAGCQMHLKQWGTTLALFLEDRNGRLPQGQYAPLWILTGRSFGERIGTVVQPPGQYHPVRTKGMLCPMATKPAEVSTGTGSGGDGAGVEYEYETAPGGTFRAWVLTEFKPEFRVSYGSYGFNGWLFRPPPDPCDPLDARLPLGTAIQSYTDVFSLRHRDATPLLLDSRSHYGLPTADTPPPQSEESTRSSNMTPFCLNRHDGYVNCLFLDWSVRKVGLKELWTLKWHKDFNTMGPWTNAGGRSGSWPYWMRNFKDY
jgi:prepilin-type processing-associated H-X9-DG protein